MTTQPKETAMADRPQYDERSIPEPTDEEVAAEMASRRIHVTIDEVAVLATMAPTWDAVAGAFVSLSADVGDFGRALIGLRRAIEEKR
jgi:hypothetical protein